MIAYVGVVPRASHQVVRRQNAGCGKIIGSRGRHILVAPEQADLVSAKMAEVADWIRNAAGG